MYIRSMYVRGHVNPNHLYTEWNYKQENPLTPLQNMENTLILVNYHYCGLNYPIQYTITLDAGLI